MLFSNALSLQEVQLSSKFTPIGLSCLVGILRQRMEARHLARVPFDAPQQSKKNLEIPSFKWLIANYWFKIATEIADESFRNVLHKHSSKNFFFTHHIVCIMCINRLTEREYCDFYIYVYIRVYYIVVRTDRFGGFNKSNILNAKQKFLFATTNRFLCTKTVVHTKIKINVCSIKELRTFDRTCAGDCSDKFYEYDYRRTLI